MSKTNIDQALADALNREVCEQVRPKTVNPLAFDLSAATHDRINELVRAAQVIILTQQTRDFLIGADPNALTQLSKAVEDIGGTVFAPHGHEDLGTLESLAKTAARCQHLLEVLQS